MKRVFFKITGIISLVADVCTLTPLFQEFLSNTCKLDENVASIIKIIVVILVSIIFVLSLIWLWFDSKLKDAGPRDLACSTKAFMNYRFYNKNYTLIKNVHKKIYHDVFKLISEIKDKRRKNNNKNLDYQEYGHRIKDILKNYQFILRETFGLDLSIILYLTGFENGNLLLKRWIFIQNKKELSDDEQREAEQDSEDGKRIVRYIIRDTDNKSLEGYATNAQLHQNNNKNGNYLCNSVFDYLITSTENYFISNDLEIDEKEGQFYTTNEFYKKDENDKKKKRILSLAAFAVIPAPFVYRDKNLTRGLLTFDSKKPKIFLEKECKMLMGLMAHYIYEIMYEIKNEDYGKA